jgi:hypothetical protein
MDEDEQVPPAQGGEAVVRAGTAGEPAGSSPLKGTKRAAKCGTVVVPLRRRHDGWTPIRQRTFLRALTELGSVRDACKLVGMSNTSAYRLRDLSPDFAAAWDKALEIVAPILEQAAFERGVEGWDEPIFYQGEICGYRKRYSDNALRMLLLRQRGGQRQDLSAASQKDLMIIAREAAARAGGHFVEKMRPIEDVRASILRKIDAIERKHHQDTMAEAAARGELWLAAGIYPPDATVRELAAKAALKGEEQAQS